MSDDKLPSKPEDKCNNFNEFVQKYLSPEPITEPKCKLCNSKYRKEAEAMAERGSSAMSIFRYLEEKGEDIKYGAVNNHINEHFRVAENNKSIQAYAKRLEVWSHLSRTDEQMLNRLIESLDVEYNEIAKHNIGAAPDQHRKNVELMLKIAGTIQGLKDQLHKLHADLRPVEIFYSSLHKVVQVKLQNITNAETKRALFEVLEMMEREVGEVSTVGKLEKK